MLIKAILFDFDGTLTEPGSIDFASIKHAIGCPGEEYILEYIENISLQQKREEALALLNRFEMEAAARSKPNVGAEELLQFFVASHLRLGIISRNSLNSIRRTLENFQQIKESDFEIILSRDDLMRPKPSPEGIQAAARRLGLPVEHILVVGDFIFDIEAGQEAGAPTVFLANNESIPAFHHPPDYTIKHLAELTEIVRFSCPLPAGKLPNHLLMQFLDEFRVNDPAVLVAPNIGEDIAAIRIEGEEVLVLKSDPITFATDAIGYYAVLVSANDVATSGATPRWLLTTLLFPVGTTPYQIHQVMFELQQVSRQLCVTLCGGHTEITDAINRPIVVGQLVGTVSEKRLIRKSEMKKGDRILLTKGIAIEGTSIISREMPEKLRKLGMSQGEIETCRQFLSTPGISILREAEIASNSGRVTAMHDVTEGGLATALEEMSAAGKHRIQVYMESIPVLKETKRICQLLNLDPLGLIGSGCLLICCEAERWQELAGSIRAAGIEVTCIGEVLENGVGVEAFSQQQNKTMAWPRFEVDEITRLFG